jgi:hypothetical protein
MQAGKIFASAIYKCLVVFLILIAGQMQINAICALLVFLL